MTYHYTEKTDSPVLSSCLENMPTKQEFLRDQSHVSEAAAREAAVAAGKAARA